MHTLYLTFFLNIDTYSFIDVIYAFLTLLAVLLVLLASFTINKKRTELNKQLWQQTIAGLISEAVFTDEDEVSVDMADNIEILLQKAGYRNCLINELIKAKINLSGVSEQNLKKLYEILKLDKDSFRKLKNRKAHIKAKGIQELAIMEQVKYVKKIFRLTNSSNELIRNEAQCAIVGFYGFSGLRFLNVTIYPISQWQQIQLLNKLTKVGATNFEPLKKWLQSPNESVIIFSLKLAAYYNCNNVYDDIINCLQNPAMQVKLYALDYLKKIPGENGADQIISHYFPADKTYKLAVLDALIAIGSVKQLSFVLQQLRNEDDDIKAAAAKCLSELHPLGKAFLQTHLFADQNPREGISLQNKNDRAA